MNENFSAALDTLAGQVAAQRITLIALALAMPCRSQFRQQLQDLLHHQQELLIAEDASDDFLAGLELAADAMLKMIPPSGP